jgi:hypothetical protein
MQLSFLIILNYFFHLVVYLNYYLNLNVYSIFVINKERQFILNPPPNKKKVTTSKFKSSNDNVEKKNEELVFHFEIKKMNIMFFKNKNHDKCL